MKPGSHGVIRPASFGDSAPGRTQWPVQASQFFTSHDQFTGWSTVGTGAQSLALLGGSALGLVPNNHTSVWKEANHGETVIAIRKGA